VAALAEEVAASADLSVEQVEHETDPVQQLRVGSHIIRRLNERSWLVTDILRSAQGTDLSLSEIWQLWEERHLAAIRMAMASLESRGALSSTSPSTTPSMCSTRWPAQTSTVPWSGSEDGHRISTSGGCSDWPAESSSPAPLRREPTERTRRHAKIGSVGDRPPTIPRFVVSVQRRVVSVDPRGNWG
jgi:hypothetical protein